MHFAHPHSNAHGITRPCHLPPSLALSRSLALSPSLSLALSLLLSLGSFVTDLPLFLDNNHYVSLKLSRGKNLLPPDF